jgi:hypothetical protein
MLSSSTPPNNKYNVVSDLQNYMFSKQMPLLVPVLVPVLVPALVPTKRDIVIKSLFFSPRGQQDTLFWCFYVMANGMVSYEKEVASFENEKIEKIKYISILRNNKDILKQHGIHKFSEIESNLSLDKQVSLNTFFALCALEKLNATVIKNRIYSDIVSDLTSQMHTLECHNGKFKLEYEMKDISTLTYQNTHFKLPLKSISSYKLNELQLISNKLEIVLPSGCKKKQDIYVLIKECVNKIDCI